MISEANYPATGQDSVDRILGGLTRVLVDNAEHVEQRPAPGICERPAGDVFRDRIEEGDPPFCIGGDDRITDTRQCDLEPFTLLLQLMGPPLERRLGGKQLPLGPLPRVENGFDILERSCPDLLVFLVVVFHNYLLSIASAKAVPATRARILANARSREVDLSSQNGAKPQSSVVPS